jgi:hypothetical protein
MGREERFGASPLLTEAGGVPDLGTTPHPDTSNAAIIMMILFGVNGMSLISIMHLKLSLK